MSKFKIFDIRKSKPGNRLYFFDANVWLWILNPPLQPKYYEEAYLNFWRILIEKTTDKKVAVVNTLLLSEILNRYLRIRFVVYKNELLESRKLDEKGINKLDFKKDYRTTQDYQNSLESFKDDLAAYASYIEFNDSGLEQIDSMQTLMNITPDSDFNDTIYYNFCIINQYAIVTHDGDFAFPDIPILTCNKSLLEFQINK
ncbi:hypothetical protein [Rufibacter quisquiliarum]|uniref:PIN domain-containing protein n=1 Tax=Rufibacter quisquiliarum TaxID=1549639 RepID=A0A839GUH7_9BACT|nr:hypothetical protein [Rufibacter quisquiliarum]MBA9078436.1 hypothetical protein [Rufibacter quisquiliarum]